jgi:malonyl-CoA O-methyltransferase
MRVDQEFSKHAHKYQQLNQIQAEVAKHLVSSLAAKPKKILDLGCGSGAIYSLIDWDIEKFVGVDFAPNMLALHPQNANVKCLLGDFNDSKLFETLQQQEFDYIISASALQWSQNLENVFEEIAKFKAPFSLALFTSGTFETLHKTARIISVIPSLQTIEALAKRCLHASVEKVNYRLEFENTREMFRYIKKSGVSGGRNILSFKQTKQLMQEYPLDYLEFEVVYINSFSKA